jgi:hypothetical protein
MAFYFALPSDESQHLAGFSAFEKQVFSDLVHTLRLGVHLHQKVDGSASDLDKTVEGHALARK